MPLNSILEHRYQQIPMKKIKGFTLIEILIAMFVLAIGLLGLAGLQATGVRNNLSAYYRSQATQMAYDMADRMRANNVDASKLDTSVYATMDPAAAADQNGCRQVAGTCSSAQIAQNDMFEWNRAIVGGVAVAGPPALDLIPAILPLGRESIGVVGRIYTININWDDNRDGCVNPQDNDAGVVGCVGVLPNDPNFQMSFQL